MILRALVIVWSSLMGTLMLCAVSFAEPPWTPAVTVNQDVITVYDIQQRIALTLLQTRTEPTAENSRQIASATIDALITEKLFQEEAERHDLLPEDAEIDAFISEFERERQIPPGGVKPILGEAGIDYQTFRQSIMARITQDKLVGMLDFFEIVVTDQEVAREKQRLSRKINEDKAEQVRVQTIFLSSDTSNPNQLEQTMQNLRRTLEQGAEFSALARQLSNDASSRFGGDLGWLDPEDLHPDIQPWLKSAIPNEISPTFTLPFGVALFKFLDRRSGTLTLPPDADIRQKLGQLKLNNQLRSFRRQLWQQAVIDHKVTL